MRTIKSSDTFSGYHPVINFIFFALVMVFTMFLMHPVYLAISGSAAVAYCIYLRGRRAMGRSLAYLLPLMLLAVFVNAAFTHKGATILLFLPSGNPLTLESVLYGVGSAVMLAAILLWFVCYTQVMTSDKFIYLFGRVIPAASLLLSMILRFVPLLGAQLRTVTETQRGMGRDVRKGTLRQRTQTAVVILSIVITWAMENAIETADSMKCRGYGLPGRTAFSIYRFGGRDRLMLLWLCFCGGSLVAAWIAGGFAWHYYPVSGGAPVTPLTVMFLLFYAALCLTPLLVDIWADRQWKSQERRAK